MSFFQNNTSGGSTSAGGSTTISSNRPWKAQRPFLREVFGTASELGKKPISYFPGETVAGLDPSTLEAWGGIEDRARTGSPLNSQAQRNAMRSMSGYWLDSNPHLDGMYDRAAGSVSDRYMETVLPALESRFARAGRTGSPAFSKAHSDAQGNLAGELSGLATDIYGGNYERERGRMVDAERRAPLLANVDYADLDRLASVGGQRQAYEQLNINADRERYDWEQMEPWNRLGLLASTIYGGGVIPGTSISSTSSNSTTGTDGFNYGFNRGSGPTGGGPGSLEKTLGFIGALFGGSMGGSGG